jgi:hypothetical protein
MSLTDRILVLIFKGMLLMQGFLTANPRFFTNKYYQQVC